MNVRHLALGLAAAAILAVPAPSEATMLKHMNLGDLSRGSDKIFRGTVTAIDSTTVEAGGGRLPIVIYRITVSDAIKGDFVTKGSAKYAEIRMLAPDKMATRSGGHMRGSLFRDLPRLEMGGDYLLFTTRPSSKGLSTTLGLGQGLFKMVGAEGHEKAVNAFDNAGLFRGIESVRESAPARGPIPYTDLAGKIRSLAR